MAICEHEPLSKQPNLMSREKREWWTTQWKEGFDQPRVAVLHNTMNTTPRPTKPDQSIASGFMRLNKFHDRESGEILKAILELDPHFFDTYPRLGIDPLTGDQFQLFAKAVIGEAAQAFYRFGLTAYGKPRLRKNAPLAAI